MCCSLPPVAQTTREFFEGLEARVDSVNTIAVPITAASAAMITDVKYVDQPVGSKFANA